jgi:hypothetical protein
MIIDCLSKAILLFVIYNIVALMLFGVPRTLGMTYYLFKAREDCLKALFPVTIILICLLLLPCWLEISNGSPWRLTAFLSAGSLLFVGFVPAFKSSKMEDYLHDIAAYVGTLFGLLWIIMVTPFWYIILIVLSIVSIIAIWTKTWRTSYIYWLEMVAFASTFISITCYYVMQMV